LGGGLKMAAGLEKDCPKFLYNIGLEFVWRLRGDTKRRLKRLLYTYVMYILFLLSNKKILIKKII
jgi:UDP-N-acetyl-D-mannosaminuronic acid transferase (WecB/TagA/CpsF family)